MLEQKEHVELRLPPKGGNRFLPRIAELTSYPNLDLERSSGSAKRKFERTFGCFCSANFRKTKVRRAKARPERSSG